MTIQRFFHGSGRLASALVLLLHLTLLAAPKATPSATHEPDIATLIAFLQPNSPVLTVGDMAVTWQELAPYIQNFTASQKASIPSQSQLKQKLRNLLQAAATRGLLLQEARSMNLKVSDEDKLGFEKDLEKSLKKNSNGLTKEAFIKSFTTSPSTMLALNYRDALLLMKLDQVVIGTFEISPNLIKQYLVYAKAVNKTLEKENNVRRIACKKILADKQANSDKGFSDLVKQFSEGVEAKWGGELKYDFSRDELAAVCYLDKFDFKVGENTPVCETNSAFRILRVLREIPQSKGLPPKLRVAQILVGKVPMQDTSEPAIKAKLSHSLKKKKIELFVQKLTKKYPVASLFFPHGLWNTPSPKKK